MAEPPKLRPGAGATRAYEPPLSSPGARFPAPETVHRIHDRYLIEVVEQLNLCPFARRSRELGHVHRPLLAATASHPGPADAAAAMVRVLDMDPGAEIILLTFVHQADHPFRAQGPFEAFVRQVRGAWEALAHPTRFYMVGFHPVPEVERSRDTTADSLVPLIRRAPDPVIQCVRAGVLDEVRGQAREQAQARLRRELESLAPELRALLEGSVQTDPELSSDIARHNFQAVGTGERRARLEARLDDIRADRDRSYGG